MKTIYRKIPSWKYELLQYQKTRKFLWFTISSWKNIPSLKVIGEANSGFLIEDSIKYVSTYYEDLDDFVEKWPDVDTYLLHYQFMKDSYELNKLR
jgi:hypothetical protein